MADESPQNMPQIFNNDWQRFHVDLHISGRIEHRVHIEGMTELTKSIHHLGSTIVALSQDLKDLIGKIDTATNKIAERIDALMSRLTNSMTDAELTEVKAGFQAEIDKLTALGADPVNPVPTP